MRQLATQKSLADDSRYGSGADLPTNEALRQI